MNVGIRDWMDYEAETNNLPVIIRCTHDALKQPYTPSINEWCPLWGIVANGGGLDSSSFPAIAKKYAAKRIETDGAIMMMLVATAYYLFRHLNV